MRAINGQFTEIINGNKQFRIPVFQRDFSWSKEQWKQLWRDILDTSSAHNDNTHFMGSIVYIGVEVGAAFSRWLMIDGQQRLTTLTLLLIALRDHINESKWVGDEDGPTAEKIEAYYLKNVHESGERQYKLVLRPKDNPTLQSLLARQTLNEIDSTSDLLIEAYQYFRSVLQDPACNIEYVYQGIARLNIVDVTLERGKDNPQLVFESMNSTGVDLSQSDLVRNYLLMGLDEPEQIRLYDQYWSKIEFYFRTSGGALDGFLRDYMALKRDLTQQIRLDRVYFEFKSFLVHELSTSLEELLVDLVRVARNYASFLGIAEAAHAWINEPIGHMRSLNITQGVLIMRLYDFHEQKLLSQDDFIDSVKLIESYLLRRAVMSLQTRGYWSVFARVAHQLHSDSVFESLQVEFARLRGTYRFPSDEEFRRALKENDLYGLRACKHVLDRLENAGQGEPSPVNDYSIEHIMPQNIDSVTTWKTMLGENWRECHETYVHRLGNLTLTAYNPRYSNRSFKEKKTIGGGFLYSAVRLNQDVRNEEEWTAEQIKARTEQLTVQALQVWPHLNADEKLIQEADIRELKERAAQRNVDDLKMSNKVRQLLVKILEETRGILVDLIEIIENRSVCCYGPEFFAELMPMKGNVRAILPLELSEIKETERLTVHDTSTWKFVPNRVHVDSNLVVDVRCLEAVPPLVQMIRQAFDESRK
ncbi:MAG: DUF262 domain-containing protein [Gammaproteobacteria bacterium]|nr:DUF262 domain-containing protein [Gammaproteobacteria bacterium]MYF52419.1 DUF262 domain-containing protein [Gammaproteobacteria bacterium]MYK43522.1 DUF262 domain-containing protein [Gammaproteobacteria bacterium]